LYNDGVQAVIVLSADFGSKELKLTEATLVQVILMVQFVAFFGSLLFNWISKLTGAKRAIALSLVLWIGVLIYAYGPLRSERDFFILARGSGIVLGVRRAISRSPYSLVGPMRQDREQFRVSYAGR